MCPHQSVIDLGFCEEKLSVGLHLCLIFNEDEERHAIIDRYLAAGIAHGELVVYLLDEVSPQQMSHHLQMASIHCTEHETDGKLLLIDAEKFYYPSKTFIPEQVLEQLKYYDRLASQRNCHCARITGQMSWALRSVPGARRLFEYESRLNEITEHSSLVAICQYDARRFSGEDIFNILRVHPMTIIRGRIVHNPYYVDTQTFLTEYLPKIKTQIPAPVAS